MNWSRSTHRPKNRKFENIIIILSLLFDKEITQTKEVYVTFIIIYITIIYIFDSFIFIPIDFTYSNSDN